MSFRLALRNVRRSLRDYLVYFITLTLSVCIFYMFNSIDAQLVMLEASEYTYISTVLSIIRVVSVLVAVVLAFLIVYANNFILRRRRREIGLYLLLGLSGRRTAGMLMLETLLIGLLAMACGLLAGYMASQAMSVLTANILGLPVRNYRFVFSPEAMAGTCACFGITFLIVMALSVYKISKEPLADMLQGSKTNEHLRLHGRWQAGLLTGAGVAAAIFSYWLVLYFGMQEFALTFGPALLVNFAGTLMFFYGLSGLLQAAQDSPRTGSLRGLRMFWGRLLLSRVNTNALSMAFICTMIFLTLVIVSTVASTNAVLQRENYISSPVDVSLTAYQENAAPRAGLLEEHVRSSGIPFETFSSWCEFLVYDTEIAQGSLVNAGAVYPVASARESFAARLLKAVSVSGFNEAAGMQGAAPIALPKGTYALNIPLERVRDAVTAIPGTPITVAGTELRLWDGPVETFNLWTTARSVDVVWLILPDDVASRLPVYVDVFDANYAVEEDAGDEVMQSVPSLINAGEPGSGTEFPMILMALSRYVQIQGRTGDAAVMFVGLYVGMIFMVAGAAVLALQQLSGAADDRPAYAVLSKLGVSRRSIDRALLAQMAAYFLLPLGTAAVHSVIGITFMVEAAGVLGYGDIAAGTAAAAAFIVLVYGAYFEAAYTGAKRILRTRSERLE